MDPLAILAVLLAATWTLKLTEQRRRILFLAEYLSRFRIEKNMETVTQGYLRALGEQDASRQAQVFGVLADAERELCLQVGRLAEDIARADITTTQVSRLPLWVPFGAALFPSFDLRRALAVHARGICAAMEVQGVSARDRAFTISAELFLLQHTCHWYCRSKLVASSRMRARHRTAYEQVVASVLPGTRAEYLSLVRGLGAA